MALQILMHTPVWVWGLLAGLLALGFMQTRPRQVTPAALLALPATLIGLGLWSMAPGFAARPLTGVTWLAALSAAAWFSRGWRAPAGAQWLAANTRLQLPGSWLPMALIVAIFTLRYAAGAGSALHPQWRSLLPLQAALALVFGALAGVSLGRTLGLLALRRGSQNPGATIGRDDARPAA